MKFVFIIMSPNKVIAIYEDEDIASKVLPVLEQRFNLKLNIIKKILNPDINLVGNNVFDK